MDHEPEERFGVITAQAASNRGISASTIARRVSSGKWTRLHKGIYVMQPGSISWEQRLTGALSWCGADAVASHRAAARLWKLPGFEGDLVEISSQRTGRPSKNGIVVHRATLLENQDVTTLKGLSVTNPTRTLIDLGSVVDVDELELALEDALRRGLSSVPRIRWRLRELRASGARGWRTIYDLLDLRSNAVPTESVLETKLLQLLRKAGLPPPERQFELREKGKVIARIDLAYPAVKLAMEADGFRFHSGRLDWERDLRRRNALMLRGWRILHVSWREVHRCSDEIINQIVDALGLSRTNQSL